MSARPGGPSSAVDALLVVERRLWTNDADFYQATLAPGALFLFAETGPLTGEQAVAAIREENRAGRRWGAVTISGEHATPVTEDTVLLTYRADAQWQGESGWHRALCASLYVRLGAAWKLAFHQQSALRESG